MLKGKTVLLGVSSSIAAYKAASLASLLVKQHANVHVLMTQNATRFISPMVFETLTGNKAPVDTLTGASSSTWSTSPWPSRRTWSWWPRLPLT